MVDEDETGVQIQEGLNSGLYLVHMVSNQPIASVILQAMLILVKKVLFPKTGTEIPRDRYLRMVSQSDYDYIGRGGLYFDMTPADEQYRELYRKRLRIVSATYLCMNAD